MPQKIPKAYKKPPRVRDGQQISVYVTPELLKRIDDRREKENRSRGNMVLDIVKQWFAAQQPTEG